jgi:hypothetical protein
MEPKKISYWWAILIGLVFPIAQIVIYFLRFGEMNPYASILDHLWFFLAGAAGGLLLIELLRRSLTGVQKWIVAVAYLLGTPVSTLMMVGGGLLGPIGIILFPLINWALFSGFGFLVGRYFSRRRLGTD